MVDVIQRGIDSSGRPIKASREMWAAWDAACDELGFVPTIVQGGFVGSGGADQSAETHAGDALDIRLWDRTEAERRKMIRVLRGRAFAYWERYESQGFDLHAHLIPGPWAHPSPQALDQWNDYLNGRDGLAGNGPDYHWRPDPLVTEPPEEDDMPYTEKQLTAIVENAVAKQLETITEQIDRLDAAHKALVRKLFTNLRAILKERFGATDADLDDILGHLEP